IALLTKEERRIAHDVARAFNQRVCGFDMLRTDTGSYVCDVNGWSFVKGNKHYYDHCGRILRSLILQATRPAADVAPRIMPLEKPILRGVVAVMRHADRAPKQKRKFRTTNKRFIEMLSGGKDTTDVNVELKPEYKAERCAALLALTRDIIANDTLTADERTGFRSLATMLANSWSGSKIQMKSYKGRRDDVVVVCKWAGFLTVAGLRQAFQSGKQLRKQLFPGKEGKQLIRERLRVSHSSERRVTRTGEGVLMGLIDEDTGIDTLLPQLHGLRSCDPCPSIFDANTPEADTEEHNLEEFEGIRVVDLAPRLTRVVDLAPRLTRANEVVMALSKPTRSAIRANEQAMHDAMVQKSCSSTVSNLDDVSGSVYTDATGATLLGIGLSQIKHPLLRIRALILRIDCLIEVLQNKAVEHPENCDWADIAERWVEYRQALLSGDLPEVSQTAELAENVRTSKLPLILEAARFDATHHNRMLRDLPEFDEVFRGVKVLADICIPQFFGITTRDKLHIGHQIAAPLLDAVVDDIVSIAHPPQRTITRLRDRLDRSRDSAEAIVPPLPPTVGSVGTNLSTSAPNTATSVSSISSEGVALFGPQTPTRPHQVGDSPLLSPANSPPNRSPPGSVVREQGLNHGKFLGKARVYVTDEAHMHAMVNLLSLGGLPGVLLDRTLIGELNWLSSVAFQLFEIPHAPEHARWFVRVFLSCGSSANPFEMTAEDNVLIDGLLLPPLRELSLRVLRDRTTHKGHAELMAVIGVFRHGDRTPKQKYKVSIKDPAVIQEMFPGVDLDADFEDLTLKPHSKPKDIPTCERFQRVLNQNAESLASSEKEREKLRFYADVIMKPIDSLKIQVKARKGTLRHGIQMIIKFGGMLTTAGEEQAEMCGGLFHRFVLPSDDIERRTFLRNVKVYSNDERRVQDTAKTFLSVLYSSEDDEEIRAMTPPIKEVQLLSLVDKTARIRMEVEKDKLNKALTSTSDLGDDPKTIEPPEARELLKLSGAVDFSQVGVPNDRLKELHKLLHRYMQKLDDLVPLLGNSYKLCSMETLLMARLRLSKVVADFGGEEEGWNVSKIGDVIDNLRFEILHHRQSYPNTVKRTLRQCWEVSFLIGQLSLSQEYGMTPHSKYEIGVLTSESFLSDIIMAIQKAGFSARPEMRLYFTSESHLHGLLNMLLYSDIPGLQVDRASIIDVDFMAHLIFKLYSVWSTELSRNVWTVEVFWSSGAAHNPWKVEAGFPGSRIQTPLLIHSAIRTTDLKRLRRDAKFFREATRQCADEDVDSKAKEHAQQPGYMTLMNRQPNKFKGIQGQWPLSSKYGRPVSAIRSLASQIHEIKAHSHKGKGKGKGKGKAGWERKRDKERERERERDKKQKQKEVDPTPAGLAPIEMSPRQRERERERERARMTASNPILATTKSQSQTHTRQNSITALPHSRLCVIGDIADRLGSLKGELELRREAHKKRTTLAGSGLNTIEEGEQSGETDGDGKGDTAKTL
ncbi:histidine phosphatase superfamily protein, clade-2, partial [Kipferlia bialata]